MFNKKLKDGLEQLKKENEELKAKISKMDNAIENYKLNYLRKKIEVRSWEVAVQKYVLDECCDTKFTNFVFYKVADLAHEEFTHLYEQNKKFNYDDGSIDMIKY